MKDRAANPSAPSLRGLAITGLVALLLAIGPVLQHDAMASTAHIDLAPSSGAVGTSVTVTGTGFSSRSQGAVTFGDVRVASFKPRARGTFTATFRVPSHPGGSATVTASAGTDRAVAQFTVVAPLAAPAPAPVPAPTRPTYDVPVSIDATGQRDVTSELLTFFTQVPDNAIIRFPANGRYRVEGILQLRDRRHLSFNGNGSTIFATTTGAGTRAHWRFLGGEGLHVHDMVIRGANAAGGTANAYVDELQYQHAIDLRGVTGAVIERVSASHVYGDCFYAGLGLDAQKRWTTQLRITDSTCDSNGRQGVAVVAGRDVVVEGSRLSKIGLMPFDIEPNGTGDGAERITFRDNTIRTSRQWFFGIVGEGPVRDVVVSNNRLVGRSMSVLLELEGDQRISNVTLSGNVSDRAEWYNGNSSVIDAHRVDNLTVTGNTQPAAGTSMVLVSAARSCRVQVADNVFTGGGTLLRSITPAC